MRKNRLQALAAAAGMLVLILDSRAALQGAREGIELCIRTLVPSLFPFFVLSSLLTGRLIGQPIRILRPMGILCGVPEGAESLLAVGLLGGYPVGAQNIAQAYRSGGIEKSDGEHLLAFCNNAGPAFIFGILGHMFSDACIPWLLWGVHVVSALMVSILLTQQRGKFAAVPRRSSSIFDALELSLKVMALVCGWVVLFRMILTFLERWFLWMLPEVFRMIAAGILELSNGCILLEKIPTEGLRFLLAGVFLSAGGLCVTMQTISVTKGLSLKLYFVGKTLQSGISFLLCGFLQIVFVPEHRVQIPGYLMGITMLFFAVLSFMMVKRKKISSNPAAVGV